MPVPYFPNKNSGAVRQIGRTPHQWRGTITQKAVVSQRPQTLAPSEAITASKMENNSFSADMIPLSIYIPYFPNKNGGAVRKQSEKIRPDAASGVQFPGDGSNAADNAHTSLILTVLYCKHSTVVNAYSVQNGAAL